MPRRRGRPRRSRNRGGQGRGGQGRGGRGREGRERGDWAQDGEVGGNNHSSSALFGVCTVCTPDFRYAPLDVGVYCIVENRLANSSLRRLGDFLL